MNDALFIHHKKIRLDPTEIGHCLILALRDVAEQKRANGVSSPNRLNYAAPRLVVGGYWLILQERCTGLF